MRKLRDGQTNRGTDGQTDGQTDGSDFIGRCLTNVGRPIWRYYYIYTYTSIQIHMNDKKAALKCGSNYSQRLDFLRKFHLIVSNCWTLNLILFAKLFLSLCRLLWLNPGARGEHLTSQLSWITAWLLVTRVCPVYLADELVLVFYTPLWLG